MRSFENNPFVAGVNKNGMEEGLDFAGDRLVVNPIWGVVMAKSRNNGDGLVTVEIELDDLVESKKILSVFRDWRPAEYFPLVE